MTTGELLATAFGSGAAKDPSLAVLIAYGDRLLALEPEDRDTALSAFGKALARAEDRAFERGADASSEDYVSD